MVTDYGVEAELQGHVGHHREQHEGSFDEVRFNKLLERINQSSENTAEAGSVLHADNSDPPVVAFRTDVNLPGYLHAGSADPPVNVTAGDATFSHSVSVAMDAAPATGVVVQATGAMVVSTWFRAGSLVALTGATTAGDVVSKRLFVEDVNFNLQLASSNPRMTFDHQGGSADYMEYQRTNNFLGIVIAAAAVCTVSAVSLRHSGYFNIATGDTSTAPANTTAGDANVLRLSVGNVALTSGVEAQVNGDALVTGYVSAMGVATAPANTTAGDLSAKRAHFGTDNAFTSGKELEVVGDALVSASLEVGTTSHLIGNVTADGQAGFGTATIDVNTRVTIAKGGVVYIEFPTADNTDPTGGGGAAVGRLPIIVNGVLRYLPYY